jgi:hypothetical protein
MRARNRGDKRRTGTASVTPVHYVPTALNMKGDAFRRLAAALHLNDVIEPPNNAATDADADADLKTPRLFPVDASHTVKTASHASSRIVPSCTSNLNWGIKACHLLPHAAGQRQQKSPTTTVCSGSHWQ